MSDKTFAPTVLRAVRHDERGYAWLYVLHDGWAVIPDPDWPRRRWAYGGGLAVLLSLPASVAINRTFPQYGYVGLLLVVLSLVVTIAGNRHLATGGQGGPPSGVVRFEANAKGWINLISSGSTEPTAEQARRALRVLGSRSPVLSAARIASLAIDKRFWRVTVVVSLVNGRSTVYRASGPFKPRKLARVLGAVTRKAPW
jgi:hypothetical protein